MGAIAEFSIVISVVSPVGAIVEFPVVAFVDWVSLVAFPEAFVGFWIDGLVSFCAVDFVGCSPVGLVSCSAVALVVADSVGIGALGVSIALLNCSTTDWP